MKVYQLLVISVLILLFALYIQPSQDESPRAARPITGDVEPAAVSDIGLADSHKPASSPLQSVRLPGQLWHRRRSR